MNKSTSGTTEYKERLTSEGAKQTNSHHNNKPQTLPFLEALIKS